jgi:hypothetical protein
VTTGIYGDGRIQLEESTCVAQAVNFGHVLVHGWLGVILINVTTWLAMLAGSSFTEHYLNCD